MYVPQFSFLFENEIKSCRSKLQCCFVSLRSIAPCMSLHKRFHSLQSKFSTRSELLPFLAFIHSTPQTSPIITTHTLITIPRKKLLGSARLARPNVPIELLGNKKHPNAQWTRHSPAIAITTIIFPEILPLSGTTNPLLMDF